MEAGSLDGPVARSKRPDGMKDAMFPFHSVLSIASFGTFHEQGVPFRRETKCEIPVLLLPLPFQSI
jgi:hypothetical protein